MLNKLQKQQIKGIMQQPGWDVLMIYVGKITDSWKEDNIKADTEFETIWRTAQREAKVGCLIDFFDRLDREVAD